jgi:hypothetical protein
VVQIISVIPLAQLVKLLTALIQPINFAESLKMDVKPKFLVLLMLTAIAELD